MGGFWAKWWWPCKYSWGSCVRWPGLNLPCPVFSWKALLKASYNCSSEEHGCLSIATPVRVHHSGSGTQEDPSLPEVCPVVSKTCKTSVKGMTVNSPLCSGKEYEFIHTENTGWVLHSHSKKTKHKLLRIRINEHFAAIWQHAESLLHGHPYYWCWLISPFCCVRIFHSSSVNAFWLHFIKRFGLPKTRDNLVLVWFGSIFPQYWKSTLNHKVSLQLKAQLIFAIPMQKFHFLFPFRWTNSPEV